MNNHQGNQERFSLHGQWSSRMTFILAVTGSAIGLGNIWKFPYIAGDNGGGAFVLIYLICIFVIGFPIMVSEIMIGRKVQYFSEVFLYSLLFYLLAFRLSDK